MAKGKILIFGGSGMLGSRIISLFKNKYSIHYPVHSEIDLFQTDKVKELISEGNFDAIVYCAGLTNQDMCEKEKSKALFLNYKVVKIIADEAYRIKSKLVYFSTDAVFSGDSQNPYIEKAPTNPANYYGYTKAKGEDSVLKAGSSNAVVRIISLYSGFIHQKTDFARRLIDSARKGQECFGIPDLIFNPTYIDVAVNSLEQILIENVNGVFHAAALDYISNYDFSKRILEKNGFNKEIITPVTFHDFSEGKIARRAQFPRLDTAYTSKILRGVLKSNSESIDLFSKDLEM